MASPLLEMRRQAFVTEKQRCRHRDPPPVKVLLLVFVLLNSWNIVVTAWLFQSPLLSCMKLLELFLTTATATEPLELLVAAVTRGSCRTCHQIGSEVDVVFIKLSRLHVEIKAVAVIAKVRGAVDAAAAVAGRWKKGLIALNIIVGLISQGRELF
ncbi:uncharacterized protein DS421_12g364340 [Arachis hypogaea]|nr:uncharacterized protein DS421_12g364340 [Arachis hypogaea]